MAVLYLSFFSLIAEARQDRTTCQEALITSQYHEMACFLGGYKEYRDDREGSDHRRLKLIHAYYPAPANPTAHTRHKASLTLADLDEAPLFDNAAYIELDRTMEVSVTETQDGFWHKYPALRTRSVSPYYNVFANLEVRVLPLLKRAAPKVVLEAAPRPASPSLDDAAARPTFFGGALLKPSLLESVKPYKIYDASDLSTNPLRLFSIATVAVQLPSQGNGELYTIDSCERYASGYFDPVPVKISCRYFDFTRSLVLPTASFP